MAQVESSILKSVRQSIGPGAQYDVFDNDLIMHINTCFSRLCQLGVGPSKPFKIEDASDEWDDFMREDQMPDDVKQYVCLKTRLVFDPPASSTVLNALRQQVDELEWTLKETARFGY